MSLKDLFEKKWKFVTTQMDRKGIVLSDISQQRKTNNLWYHLYVESLKNIYNRIKQKQTIDTENKSVVVRGKENEGMEKRKGNSVR